MKFEQLTLAQQAAVREQGNILVSAAAGSGKTAVLVERIIDALTRKNNPLSADRLLVVTFTVAAASEMRSRLEKGLDEYLADHPFDSLANKQKILLNSAKICTIDSFCISLLRENFEKADLDPDFKIAEENEILAASNVALSNLMQRCFQENTIEFNNLLDALGCTYDERNLTDNIVGIYQKAQNLPFYKTWLELAKDKVKEENFVWWQNMAFSQAKKSIEETIEVLKRALLALDSDESVKKAYFTSVSSGISCFEKMLKSANEKQWDALYKALETFKFEAFSNVKGSKENPVALLTKEARDFATKQAETLKKLIFEDQENIKNNYLEISKLTETLIDLTIDYADEFEAQLKSRSLLTFSNAEQAALGLICEQNNGNIKLKEDAYEYISAYDEILVDEYQDVNDLQDILFSFLSDNNKHLFVVGDVKQSIYGFRGANPNNFLKRRKEANDYSACSSGAKKIILDANFRSEKDICDFANFFFTLFMRNETCGMDYTKEDYLDAKAPIESANTPGVEAHLIESDDFLSEKQSEAVHIADYIQAVMLEEAPVYDKNLKSMRKARYGDFAIILRNIKGNSNIVANELKRRGIPVSYSKDSFLESREIMIMISLLSVISNPLNNIDMLTVLASPIFSFTPEEIAAIRTLDKKSSMYSAVLKSANAGNKKAADFISALSDYRNYAVLYPLSKLISVLLDKTGFLNMAAKMSEGEIRRANLNLLLSEAGIFEKNSKSGLEGFLRYLKSPDAEKIKPATLVSTGDSVKIMSVHYSKGLQFPICILGFLSATFNTSDIKNSLIFDIEDGISFRYFGDDGKHNSLPRQLLSIKAKEKMLAEELRLLYVAATRAENKLVLMLSQKNMLSAIEKSFIKAKLTGFNASKEVYFSATCLSDWILAALISHPEAILLKEISGLEYQTKENCGRLSVGIYNVTDTSDLLNFEAKQAVSDENIKKELNKRFSYKYPFEELLSLNSKTSVSQLVHKNSQENFDFTDTPSFMLKSELNAAQKGTATHKVMQYMDFNNAETDLQAELERLKEWEFITPAEYNAVNKAAIKEFINSSLFKRIKHSSKVMREMKFLTALPAGDLYGDISKEIKNEPIIVQGSIDCLFFEEDGIVVIDFKTDRVNTGEELISRYKQQLDVYSHAAQKIYQMPIKQKIIYSLNLNSEIDV